MNRCRHRDKHYLTNFLTTQNKNHDLQPQQAGEHSVQPPVGQPGLHPPVKPPGLNPQMDPPDQDQADHHQPHQAVPLLSKQQEEPVQLPLQPPIPVYELQQPLIQAKNLEGAEEKEPMLIIQCVFLVL